MEMHFLGASFHARCNCVRLRYVSNKQRCPKRSEFTSRLARRLNAGIKKPNGGINLYFLTLQVPL